MSITFFNVTLMHFGAFDVVVNMFAQWIVTANLDNTQACFGYKNNETNMHPK